MIVVACLEAAVIVAVLALLLRHVEAQRAAHDAQYGAWRDERRELLNRIQRPEFVPVAPVTSYPAPDPEPDDIELVGTIRYEDPPEE